MNIFTVFDSKAKYYLNPFITNSQGEGLRQFIAAANDPQHPFYLYSTDFTLWQLGTFEPQTGEITVFETPLEACRAWEVKNTPLEEKGNSNAN